MPTKTISVDVEAYRRLSEARRDPRESFSHVIKRAVWTKPSGTAGALLESLPELPMWDADTLDRMDAAQANDQPPEDPWRSR